MFVEDGDGFVSHRHRVAGRGGGATDLTAAPSRTLGGLRERRGRHDAGSVLRDLAVMVADGGDCLADLRAVRDQEPVFGPVASDATAFRLIVALATRRA